MPAQRADGGSELFCGQRCHELPIHRLVEGQRHLSYNDELEGAPHWEHQSDRCCCSPISSQRDDALCPPWSTLPFLEGP